MKWKPPVVQVEWSCLHICLFWEFNAWPYGHDDLRLNSSQYLTITVFTPVSECYFLRNPTFIRLALLAWDKSLYENEKKLKQGGTNYLKKNMFTTLFESHNFLSQKWVWAFISIRKCWWKKYKFKPDKAMSGLYSKWNTKIETHRWRVNQQVPQWSNQCNVVSVFQ